MQINDACRKSLHRRYTAYTDSRCARPSFSRRQTEEDAGRKFFLHYQVQNSYSVANAHAP